jgi:hypothetical protein
LHQFFESLVSGLIISIYILSGDLQDLMLNQLKVYKMFIIVWINDGLHHYNIFKIIIEIYFFTF